VIDLDDPRALAAGDPGGMLGVVSSLGDQCRRGYGAGSAIRGAPSLEGVATIVFCGIGGSAVAGDVLRVLYRNRLGIPIDVNRATELPAYATTHSLAIVSSYSGNTSEALGSFRDALQRGCRVVTVTSGGALAREAADAGLPVVLVPGGLMPRAALGFLSLAMLGALEAMGILPPLETDVAETVAELEVLARRLGPDVPRAENAAKEIAWQIGDRTPVIWGAEGIGAVAAGRWKTQFNENAKIPAWSAPLPELDHNEVVGWTAPAGQAYLVIALRHQGEPHDVAVRFPPTMEIAQEAGAPVHEVQAAGRSSLARLFSLVLMGDFASTYHGLAHGRDPSPIAAIDRLKAALAEAGT
jgi:glucose/mannose-6-phosphate isomerase